MRVSRPDTDLAAATIQIVPMRPRHLASVVAIDGLVYPQPWSRSLYEGELAQPEAKRVYVVARAGRRVVGHAGLIFVVDQGHITTVAVHPDWQGRGIGAGLVLAVTREAVARHATDITLEVRVSNTVAQRLYERFGFKAEGVRKGYYADPYGSPPEDAVIMWAYDVGSANYQRKLATIAAEVGPGVVDNLALARAQQRRRSR